jgi:hypothetical protein
LAQSTFSHKLSASDPPIRTWYLFNTSRTSFPDREQVPESEVPDRSVWWADWEVMSDHDKAQLWNDFDEFRGFKERQRALRRGERIDKF